jgi:U6 snRNA-associated Sm-like protein LSm7
LSPTDCASCLLKSILVSGMLKGYDQLMNLVLDDVKESMRGKWLNNVIKLDEASNIVI